MSHILGCMGNFLGSGLSETGNLGSIEPRLPAPIARLRPEEFGHVLSFLEPEDLARSERVSRAWNRFILADQWKIQFQIRLGLPPGIASKDYLPEGLSYKQAVLLVFPSLLDKRVYEHYIGKIGPVSPPPKDFFKRWNEPDPCDPTKTIGEAYVLMDCPSYIEIDGFLMDRPSHIEIDGQDYSLDGIDDPNTVQAPKLIRNEDALESTTLIRREEDLEVTAEKITLKVPVTINNIVELFKHPKTGNPSTYRDRLSGDVVKQHGNERLPEGWICMRKDVIGKNLSFPDQQTLVTSRGVVLSELLPRILFNFTQHVRSQRAGVYPDGQDPWTFARTLTLTRDLDGNDWPSGCGAGGPSGLFVCHFRDFKYDFAGVAVVLPAEVKELSS